MKYSEYFFSSSDEYFKNNSSFLEGVIGFWLGMSKNDCPFVECILGQTVIYFFLSPFIKILTNTKGLVQMLPLLYNFALFLGTINHSLHLFWERSDISWYLFQFIKSHSWCVHLVLFHGNYKLFNFIFPLYLNIVLHMW